jgi:hypothetical protein
LRGAWTVDGAAILTPAATGALSRVASIARTNGVTLADGVLNATNGVYFVPPGSANRYWLLLEAVE